MSLGTGKHGAIIKRLESIFDHELERTQQPWIALAGVVGLRSPRSEHWDTVRIPAIQSPTFSELALATERVLQG
jgi:hypothetical protein